MMRFSLLVLAGVALPLAVCASEISGTVTGTNETTRLQGIQVRAYKQVGSSWDWVNSASTAANGDYTLDGLSDGTYRLEFVDQQDLYLIEWYDDDATDLESAKDIVVPAGTMVAGINVSLAPPSKISGTVTGPDGSTTLPDITVSAYSWKGSSWVWKNSGSTGENGAYTIGGLPAGTYRLKFEDGRGDYITEVYNGVADLTLGTNIVVAAATTVTNINASLAAAGKISGTVTGPAGITPLAGITVSACTFNGLEWTNNVDVATDESGHYTIGGLLPGTYRLKFEDGRHGYITEVYNDVADLASGTNIVVIAAATVTGINASLANRLLPISGKVTGLNGVTPLPGIRVTAYTYNGWDWEQASQGETDSRGDYTLNGLPEGTYKVQFYDPLDDITEVYDNAPDLDSGTPIVVPGETSHINASLARGAAPGAPVIVGLRRTGMDAWELLLTGTVGEQYILQETEALTTAWGDVDGSQFLCQQGTNVVPREQSGPAVFWRFRVFP